MMGILVVGYFIVALITLGPDTGSSGETWFSLLLESWFWIGVPLVVSAGLGAAGWLIADRLAGRGTGTLTGGTGAGRTPTERPAA